MGAVAFVLGKRPSVTASEVVALAEFLSRRRTVAAATAPRKIKTAAVRASASRVQPGGVELTRPEMIALKAARTDYGPTPLSADALSRLRRELEQAIASPRR
jgi:hypothetical protein